MRYILALSVIIALWACSTSRNVASTPVKQTFNFDYKTLSLVRPGSGTMLVNLVQPNYASNFRYGTSGLFRTFQQHMGKDIEELLVDKGFRLKGTFDSFGDMIFEDRKDADIALEIEIVPEFTAREGSWKSHRPWAFSATGNQPTYYYYEGTASLIGKINLTGYEPLSREKIWVKSVPIPAITNINITTHTRRLSSPSATVEFFDDPNVYNALGKALSEQYAETFKKIDLQLDPREFESLKGQIRELKAKKGY